MMAVNYLVVGFPYYVFAIIFLVTRNRLGTSKPNHLYSQSHNTQYLQNNHVILTTILRKYRILAKFKSRLVNIFFSSWRLAGNLTESGSKFKQVL